MWSLTFDPYYMNNMLKQESHTVVIKIESPFITATWKMKYRALQSTFKKVIIIVKLLSLFNNLAVLFWLTDIWEVWKGCEVSRQHVVFCMSCRAQNNLFFGWWPDMMSGQRKLYSVLSRNWLVKILGKNFINPCVIFWLTFIFFTKGQNLRFTGEDLAMGNVRRIHDFRISPPQKHLCIVGTAGEKEKESAWGTIFPLPVILHALFLFFDYCYFYSDTQRDTQRDPLRRRERL